MNWLINWLWPKPKMITVAGNDIEYLDTSHYRIWDLKINGVELQYDIVTGYLYDEGYLLMSFNEYMQLLNQLDWEGSTAR